MRRGPGPRSCRVPLLAAALAVFAARADEPADEFVGRFGQRDGAALYAAICQGCHMPDGRGAQGAGAYPALAANPRTASAVYVAATVLKGRRAMPAFAGMLDDAQVAEVVNYVRTHLGNRWPGAIGPEDVKPLR